MPDDITEELDEMEIVDDNTSRWSIIQSMLGFIGLKYNLGDSWFHRIKDGSELLNIFEAIAIPVQGIMKTLDIGLQQFFIEFANGDSLDRKAAQMGQFRILGNAANTYCTFFVEPDIDYDDSGNEIEIVPSKPDILIPVGTQVTSQYEPFNIFETKQPIILPTDKLDIIGYVEALEPGIEYNMSAGTLQLILNPSGSMENYVVQVNNTEVVTGGTDSETDNEFRKRLSIMAAQPKSCTRQWYTYIINQFPNVHDSVIDIRLNTNSEYIEKNVYVNFINSPDVNIGLQNIINHFKLDENDCLDPLISYNLANETIINLNLTVIYEVNIMASQTNQDIKNNALTLFNNLNINDDLPLSTVYSTLNNTNNTASVIINNINNDLIQSDNTVYRLGTITINGSVV